MGRWMGTGLSLLLALVCGTAVWAMDFGAMSNQELAELRGAIENAPPAEQDAFRLEWEKRLATMGEEEKKRYVTPDPAEPAGDGQGKNPTFIGRGYENQGMGVIIFGGDGKPSQGKKSTK